MYAAVLAIISCVGAWLTWRAHPVYSPTATFRVAGEVLLLIIGCICIIILTVRLIENQPVSVQVGALSAVIVGVTLAMVFSITALTTPKSAHLTTELPPDVPVVNLRRRNVTHWVKLAGVFVAICAAACFIPGPTRYVAGTMLGMSVLLGCILVPTAWFMARRFDRSATALQLHPWLHWRYSPQEWQAWSEARVERLAAEPASFRLKRDWRRILPVAGGVLFGALFLIPGSWGARSGWAVGCFLVIIGWLELAAWDARRAPQKLRTLLKRVVPEVWFGEDGLLCDDHLLTWLGADVYLTSVSADERAPRSLLLQFEKVMPNPYGAPVTARTNQSVLIPTGAAAGDLEVLRKALTGRCPRATLSF